MASEEHLIWRAGTARVWVSYDDTGALVFAGEDSAYLGEPGHSYEYWVTVAPEEFPALRHALAAEPAADVLDLVRSRAEEIVTRGERSWLDDHGIARGFSCR
ncbi:hypothetical protein [Mycolicibacterium sp.]|uniref:hypothetical protein n=1 Tax=Mycolicibacterium sp. TaxID=2320850 RepID=UPI003D13F08F